MYCIAGFSVWENGGFQQNCLEIATKTVLFKTFAAGLDAEFQIAMFSNLVFFFTCKCVAPAMYLIVVEMVSGNFWFKQLFCFPLFSVAGNSQLFGEVESAAALG